MNAPATRGIVIDNQATSDSADEELTERLYELRNTVWQRMSFLAEEVHGARFREVGAAVNEALVRCLVHPRRLRDQERWACALCCALIILGDGALVVFANYDSLRKLAPHGKGGAGSFGAPELVLGFVAIGFSLLGLMFQRRYAIVRVYTGRTRASRLERVKNRRPPIEEFHHYLPLAWSGFAGLSALTVWEYWGEWPAGWLTMLVSNILIGYAAGKLSLVFLGCLFIRSTPGTVRVLDRLVCCLFDATTALFFMSRFEGCDDRRFRMRVRASMYNAAGSVEADSTPLLFTWKHEKKLRSEIRSDRAKVAAVMRSLARKLAVANSAEEHKEIRDAMLAGLFLAIDGNLPGLVESAPDVSRSSRLSRVARHVAPAVAMMLFAVVIPLLPGANEAASSVRVFLIATAALTLIPGTSTARGTIESALTRSLPGQQK